MSGFGQDFFTDIPFYLDPNFGLDVGLGIYDQLAALGIPHDEIFNPDRKQILLLKKSINALSVTIQNESAWLSGSIKRINDYLGKPSDANTFVNFESSIKAVASAAITVGLVKSAAVTAVATTALPVFAFIGFAISWQEALRNKEIEQLAKTIPLRVATLKTQTEDLAKLINQLEKQEEKVNFVAPPKPYEAPVNNQKYYALGILGLGFLTAVKINRSRKQS